MAVVTPENAKTISAGTWEQIATFTATTQPRGYAVRNKLTSANECEIFIVGLHGEAAPTEGLKGYSLAVGEAKSFFRAVPNGQGAIRDVYARSANATITHAIDVG